jgi:hypothetical protein
MPRNSSVIDVRGPLTDHHHAGDASSGLDAALGSPLCPPGAQASGQLSAKLTSALDEQGLVDGFVAHPHHRIVWVLEPQPPGDLLGRPPLDQPPGHLRGQLGMGQFGAFRPAGALVGPVMCSPRSIVASSAIRRHLPGHRGDRPFQLGGDGAQSVTPAQPQADLLSFGECQPAWAGRPRIAPHSARFGLLKNEPDVLPRAADLLPDLPKRVTPRSQPQYKPPLLCGQAWSSHFATSPVDTSLLSSPRNCVDPLNPPS